jgi:hypothetical protein
LRDRTIRLGGICKLGRDERLTRIEAVIGLDFAGVAALPPPDPVAKVTNRDAADGVIAASRAATLEEGCA